MNKRGKKFFKIFSLIFLVAALLFLFAEIPFIKGVDSNSPNATSIIPVNNTQTTNHAVVFSAELNDDTGLSDAYLYVFDSNGNLVSTQTENYDSASISFTQISSGSFHTCGILTNGTAMCWSGYNIYGQLGDNTFEGKNYPNAVYGGYTWSQISAGYDYTCGVLTNGSGLCWGYNGNSGQLGNGTAGEYQTATPQPVSGNYAWSKISCGSSNTCGILTNGSGLCWGYNGEGQVGNGTLGGSFAVPVPVSGNYNFSQIVTYNTHTCGLLTNSTLLCWGDNSNGQLGNGTLGGTFAIPVPVLGYNFSQVSVSIFTCGLLTNSTLLCWGYNGDGELGNGTIGGSTAIPQPASGNYNWSQISLGLFDIDFFHNCGVLTNGTAMCWGTNNFSELGDNDIGNSKYVPTAISGNYNLSFVSSGLIHTCGLFQNGTALCWGDDSVGQLGDNLIIYKSTPTPISINSTFSGIYSGMCGVLTNKSGVCWGHNYYGILGDNTTTQRNVPVFISGGYNWSQISGQIAHTCGVLTNGSGLCWGSSYYGELGNGSNGGQSNVPIAVSGNYNFSSISAGWAHNCGVLTNGSGLCWGYNAYGALGDGTTTSRNVPTPISGNYNFSSISSGDGYSCGLLINGSAMCWGWNYYGALGNGSTGGNISTPRFVSGNYNFSSISSGQYWYSCGLLINGSAMCWGLNENGMLGNGSIGDSNIPIAVSGNYNFSYISAGTSHVCGLLTNGSAMCWGNSGSGQVGNGTAGISVYSPVFVSGNYNWSQISGGWSNTCGVLTNGTGLCWGDDYYGELGDNFSATKTSPVLVYSKIIFSNTINLVDGVYKWFMSIFDRSGNNCNTGNYTLTVYTASAPASGGDQSGGGSLPPLSGGETVYVPAALNDNFWTGTTIILAENWQPVQEFALTGESTPITETEAQILEQQLINELRMNPNAETQEIVVKEITENISIGERLKVDVKNSSYYVGVANVSSDSVIVQVSGSGGGSATQSLMKVGDVKKFDLNNDGLTDMKIEIVSLEASTKAGIKIEVVYNGLLNAKEIQKYNQEQKSNKLLMFAFIFIGVLVAITIYFRFRKYK